MSFEEVIVEKQDGIGRITMNRPEKLNAINMNMLNGLDDALTELEGDPDIRVIILTGAGRAFSVGRDLKELGTNDHKTGLSVWGRFESISKPTIASINGYCLAGALSMMMCCDLAVAAEDATIGDVHTKAGIVHGGGATQRLKEIVGIRKAKELLFTCDPLTGAQAELIGLVNRAVPRDQLETATMELAAKIAANSPVSISAAKFAMNQGMKYGVAVGLDVEAREYQRHRAEHTEDINTSAQHILSRNK